MTLAAAKEFNKKYTTDASARYERLKEKMAFSRARRAEITYARQLRAVARHVADIIRAFPLGNPQAVQQVIEYLNRYSQLIGPWAQASATKMIAQVSQRDKMAWDKLAKQLGIGLKQEVNEAPIGDVVRKILADQVHLITSIPRDAAEEVQKTALEYMTGGRRYGAMVPDIERQVHAELAHKAHSRAVLIARTETAKAATALTQARSQSMGVTHYIWMTANDADVREAHQKLQGTIQRWDDPPIAEANGERHHPGMSPNCRCFAEPVLTQPPQT